jgi:hypothetical protein
MRRLLAPILATLFLASAASCGKEADPVRATIEALEAAVEDRDADEAAALFAAAYTDPEHADRDAALLTIRRYFTAYERISVSFTDLVVDRKPEIARATFTAAFDGAPRKLGAFDAMLPRTAKVKFEMNLVPEEGGWKVAWAGWRVVTEDQGP